MSSLKRKDAPGGTSTTKSPKRSKSDQSSAKPDTKATKPPKANTSKSTSVPAISRLKEDEPLFPRGGASVLSPLEHKQISIQAKQDVLFEQESARGTKKADGAKKKKTKISKDRKAGTSHADDSVKIESLNFQRLVKGSLVLGQVIEITPVEILLAIPNNLVGHVPITSISETLNKRIEAEAEAGDGEEGEDDVDLKQNFEIGQYLRAYVVSTVEETSTTLSKPKKRIELSIRPDLANSGLTAHDVVENSTVMASILSVEDHGLVMELGLSGSKMQGFLPRNELSDETTEARLQPGVAILCLVTRKPTNGKIVQLTTSQDKIGKVRNVAFEATTINTFLPGSAVEFMVTEISQHGISGKVMGSLDVTADLIHSGLGPQSLDLESKYKIGKKVKARVICNFPTANEPKLGISLLDHVVSLHPQLAVSNKAPLETLPISSTVEKCTILKVESDIGVFIDMDFEGLPGFVHISRLKDGKVDMLSQSTGPYKVGSVHRGRVVGYNALDGVFHLSFEQSVLEQPFLRIEDIPVGEVVTGQIEKLVVTQDGVSGLVVRLSEGINGFVPEMHLADVRLQHPEKKFREGQKVKARVLSKDCVKRQVRLTLKKTLVNSEVQPLQSFEELVVGMQTLGHIVNVLETGAVVQFYGSLRGFLPVSEMSEAYIRDPKEHFRVGQVVTVHVLNFDIEAQKLFVSCKDPSAFGIEKQVALKSLKLGEFVTAKVVEKTEDNVFVELVDSPLKAVMSINHLADRPGKSQSSLKGIRVGQILPDLVVWDKIENRRYIALSKKPSLVKASQGGKLLTSLDQANVGELREGVVRNITVSAVFIQFPGQLIAILPKSKLPRAEWVKTDFGLKKYQSLTVKIASIDRERARIVVASPESEENPTLESRAPVTAPRLENPVDETLSSMDDLFIGRITKAKISSVKSTQLNVKLADNVQGRVDVSQVFDQWEKISDPRTPLSNFRVNRPIQVKVLGVHDARNHRFLPISHRSVHSVLELSAKPSDIRENTSAALSLDNLEVGSRHIGFVNNVQQKSIWVSLSPNVRGKVNLMEISDDVSQLNNLSANFPVGSALRVRVLAVNPTEGRLDLSARLSNSATNLTWETLKKNMVLPGRITKISERQIIVQLGETLSGPVHLIDLNDDYDEANTMSFSKNDIVRVSVVAIDPSNKRLRLSSRPSRVLNSSLTVKDREITESSQLQAGDIVRGFVKNVSDKGLFVSLGGNVTAMVRISDLSDKFLKDWMDEYQVDQLVKGRITSINAATGHIQMSLKSSVVEKDFVSMVNFHELCEGQVITGKVRKVEDFGVFILVDDSANISGLCHRSELAEKPVEDARKLYNEGDAVKAIILDLDQKRKRVSFGLKPSYFEGNDSDSDMELDDSDEDDAGALLGDDEDDDSDNDDETEDDEGAVLIKGTDNDAGNSSDEEDTEMLDAKTDAANGLDAGGFEWVAGAHSKADMVEELDQDPDVSQGKKKRRRKTQADIDKSGELDLFGPRTAVDYEQLLNRQPNSSTLWIEYMALEMQVNELSKAREVAERAVSTINASEETEKLNAWVAYLNLEVRFGNEDTVDQIFKRACQVNDQQEVYQRMASIYVQEGNSSKADSLFQTLTKKFGAHSPEVWYNYAHWLHANQNKPDQARALLARATQALPEHSRLSVMTKFAALEFTSANGNPERGRTMYEGIFSMFPKRFDLWSQLLDHEDVPGADKTVVRDIFERATKVKGLKARAAMKWFRRWGEWEDQNGDAKSREKVTAKASEWARRKADAKASKEAHEEEEGEE